MYSVLTNDRRIEMTNIEAAISELEIEGYSDEEIASIVVSWIVDLYED